MKEKVPVKPVPQEQRLEIPVTPADTSRRVEPAEKERTAELPKIDLPEFVITGVESIDLPDADKNAPDEAAVLFPSAMMDPLSLTRDRATVEFLAREKSTVQDARSVSRRGLVLATLGTHFSPRAGLWLSDLTARYSYAGSAQYSSSKGFAPYTNWSSGGLSLTGDIPLSSSSDWLDRSLVGGGLSYASRTYRFYGSNTPSLARTVEAYGVGASLQSSPRSPLEYNATLGFKSLALSDSSARTTEHVLTLHGGSRLVLASLPLLLQAQAATTSLAGSTGESLPFLHASVGTETIWLGNLFARISLHFTHAQGMLGQKLTRLYPHVGLGFTGLQKSVVSLSYRPGVENASLASLVEQAPYLSATSTLRHSDTPIDLTAALETDWDQAWRTGFTVRFRSIRDYPLLSEGFQQGIWNTVYTGRTTHVTYSAGLFAKFNPNGYFAFSISVHSTKNSVTLQKIPYVPDLELTAMYRQTVIPGLTVSPWVTHGGRRSADLSGGNRLPGFVLLGVRMEYAMIGSVQVLLDVQNIADQRYEVWHGYRAEPVLVSAGASVRW